MVLKIYSICYSGDYIHLYFLIGYRILQCIIHVQVQVIDTCTCFYLVLFHIKLVCFIGYSSLHNSQ